MKTPKKTPSPKKPRPMPKRGGRSATNKANKR
jgi:hypothetical protein